MKLRAFVCGIAASAVFFASGVAIGQRAGVSKFAKYLQPVSPTTIDLITLDANADLIRDSLPMTDGISIAQVLFDRKEDRLTAFVMITPEFEKGSLETIKSLISRKGHMTYLQLKSFIPDLSEDDFVLRVRRITTDADRKPFAEYKHGNIVFH